MPCLQIIMKCSHSNLSVGFGGRGVVCHGTPPFAGTGESEDNSTTTDDDDQKRDVGVQDSREPGTDFVHEHGVGSTDLAFTFSNILEKEGINGHIWNIHEKLPMDFLN